MKKFLVLECVSWAAFRARVRSPSRTGLPRCFSSRLLAAFAVTTRVGGAFGNRNRAAGPALALHVNDADTNVVEEPGQFGCLELLRPLGFKRAQGVDEGCALFVVAFLFEEQVAEAERSAEVFGGIFHG